MNIVPNNVFLSHEELQVTLAALNNAIRDNKGLTSETLDILIGSRNEIQYVLETAIREYN
jgi:hypothetical protein